MHIVPESLKQERITCALGYFWKRLRKGENKHRPVKCPKPNVHLRHCQRYILALQCPGLGLGTDRAHMKETLIINRSVSQHRGQHHFLGRKSHQGKRGFILLLKQAQLSTCFGSTLEYWWTPCSYTMSDRWFDIPWTSWVTSPFSSRLISSKCYTDMPVFSKRHRLCRILPISPTVHFIAPDCCLLVISLCVSSLSKTIFSAWGNLNYQPTFLTAKNKKNHFCS